MFDAFLNFSGLQYAFPSQLSGLVRLKPEIKQFFTLRVMLKNVL